MSYRESVQKNGMCVRMRVPITQTCLLKLLLPHQCSSDLHLQTLLADLTESSLVFKGISSRTPTDTKIYGRSSPLYKTAQYWHITHPYPLTEFKSALDYL